LDAVTSEYSGTGDPARVMALLWRSTERTGRRRRPELSVDRIVRAAVELADAEGLAALSMRKVGERLGVGTMSLYTYVPGKAELLDLMLDTVYGEVVPGRDDTRDGWREKLERVARDNWALYLRHPWLLYVATGRPPLGPHTMAKYEHELRALDGIGLTDLEMDSALSLVLGYVHGAARGAVEAAQVEQRTGISGEQWWWAHAPLLEKIFDGTRYPLAARVGTAAGEAHGSPYDAEHNFEFGLPRVLDGIAVLVESQR
jgi:AcrR family transcriptional regulator